MKNEKLEHPETYPGIFVTYSFVLVTKYKALCVLSARPALDLDPIHILCLRIVGRHSARAALEFPDSSNPHASSSPAAGTTHIP